MYKDESNPEWMWGTQVTELDGRYLLLSIRRDTSRVRLRGSTFYRLHQFIPPTEKPALDRRSTERYHWTEPAVGQGCRRIPGQLRVVSVGRVMAWSSMPRLPSQCR